MVVLRLPSGMTPEEGRTELRRSVRFGSPEVTLMYVLEPPPEEAGD
jgi:hypothetical protein